MPLRFLVAGLAVAALHALGAVLSLGHSGRLAGFFAACAVGTALMAVALHELLRRAGPPSGDGDGGSGVRPGPGGGDGDPPWWPDFERALRRYAGERPAPVRADGASGERVGRVA